ncbi:MAG: EAL domain-containing protein [Actinobacteria bacterium]|nr:EAL domain-containing protein [Actinomycetota bacterium]MCA1719685.1 EAL domain-containing protein [Actinomycetota bacterium]
MPTPGRSSRWFSLYITLVAGLGTGLLVSAASLRLPTALPRVDAAFVVLAVLVVAAELRPITVRGRLVADKVSLSGAFICALLLHYDWSLVLAVQALASLADDARARTPWRTALFNIGQYSVSLAAASAVLVALGRPSPGALDLRSLVVDLAACAVFFVLNTELPGIAFALHDRAPVLRSMLAELPFQLSVNGVVVAMAPLVIAVAEDSLWLVALLIVPVVAVHRGAVSALERDHLSSHDRVTALPNQIAFREGLVHHLEAAAASERHVAVLVLGLDHFADVNHTLGHVAGDELLRQVAERLRAAVPEDALVARYDAGGFLISLPDLESPWAASGCAEELLQQFRDPYALVESAFAVRASIGLTVSPLHGTDPDDLVQHAEVARDIARRTRSGLEVYSADRNAFTARRLEVLRCLGPALRRREMAVHFQPQVDLATRAITGYEALLRWEHPVLGTVPPDEFVALAEHAGMMQAITEYVLDEALRRAAEWRARGSDATVSVNVSASVLQDPSFPAGVARRLALWGVPSSGLVLELTETAVMSDPERCQAVMSELRALHIGLSLDDYGTGYASLAYLTTLPVDEIKIDKSFVMGMEDSGTDRLVVRSTLELARELGLRVVAEGVESAGLVATLTSYGCRTGQGYHFGRAVAPEDLVLRLPCTG